MKTAIYLRVSTKIQETENQKSDIISFCKYHKLQYDFFEDKLSGRDMNREGLKTLMDEIALGKYNKIVVWQLSRLARSIRDLLKLIDFFEKHGCALVSIKENIDLSTPSGRLMVTVFGAFSEFEVENMKLRQRAGIDRAMAAGTKFGPKGKPFDKNKFELLYKDRTHISVIASNLGFSTSQLYKIIKRTYGVSAKDLYL